MNRPRLSALPLIASVIGGLLLTLAPLPLGLAPFKPFWIALIVIYWALEQPEHMGLGRAFLLGLACDLATGAMLGEQALRLTIIVFIVFRFRARMRFFPMLQQSLVVFALLLNDRVIALALRLLSGAGWPDVSFWGAPLVGTLFWPWLFLLLDELRRMPRRSSS